MERVTAREAANRYFQAAVEAAGGSVPALLAKLEGELPELASELQEPEERRKAINRATRWKRQNPPPAEVLIAICRVLGLSLDEAAGVTELQPSLEKRVSELETIAHQLMADYGELRREVGLPMARLRDEEEPDLGQGLDSVQTVPSRDS